jgi:hypothetical protein
MNKMLEKDKELAFDSSNFQILYISKIEFRTISTAVLRQTV